MDEFVNSSLERMANGEDSEEDSEAEEEKGEGEEDQETESEEEGDAVLDVRKAVAKKRGRSEMESKEECTVYVEGLPYETTEDEVRAHFASCGEVVDVRVPRYHDSGRARGYAHVDYADASSAQAALGLNKSKVGSRFVTVALANERRGVVAPSGPRPEGCKTVYARNVPYDATESEVKAAFEAAVGKVADVRLARWEHTQNQKGFCYVTFIKEAAADAAVRTEIKVKGRLLECDWDEKGRPKKSFKASTGELWAKTKQAKVVLGDSNKSRRKRGPTLDGGSLEKKQRKE